MPNDQRVRRGERERLYLKNRRSLYYQPKFHARLAASAPRDVGQSYALDELARRKEPDSCAACKTPDLACPNRKKVSPIKTSQIT